MVKEMTVENALYHPHEIAAKLPVVLSGGGPQIRGKRQGVRVQRKSTFQRRPHAVIEAIQVIRTCLSRPSSDTTHKGDPSQSSRQPRQVAGGSLKARTCGMESSRTIQRVCGT